MPAAAPITLADVAHVSATCCRSELELNKVAGRARSQGDATYIRLDLASFK